MDPIELLTSRVSIPVLTEPGPTASDIETMIKAAIRAPDHGQLRPWRFMVLNGENRHQLGDIFRQTIEMIQPDATDAVKQRFAAMPLRAPTVIIVIARIVEPHKIPVIEQLISAGAAAQNMLLAAHALGLGAIWRTGEMAYHSLVKEKLGLESTDEITGFIYLGTPSGKIKPVPQLSTNDFMMELPEN